MDRIKINGLILRKGSDGNGLIISTHCTNTGREMPFVLSRLECMELIKQIVIITDLQIKDSDVIAFYENYPETTLKTETNEEL